MRRRELLNAFNAVAGGSETVSLLDAAITAVCAELLTSRAVVDAAAGACVGARQPFICPGDKPLPLIAWSPSVGALTPPPLRLPTTTTRSRAPVAGKPVAHTAAAVLQRAMHPALPVHMLAHLPTEAATRTLLAAADRLAALGLPAIWHAPQSHVNAAAGGGDARAPAAAGGAGAPAAPGAQPGVQAVRAVEDADLLSRSPLWLPVAGHRVPPPPGDDGLTALLALRPAYQAIARLVAAPGTSATAVVAWATGLAGDAARWQGRAHLLLAVYYESFAARGTACTCVVEALRVPALAAALYLTPHEISAFQLLAGVSAHPSALLEGAWGLG